MGIVNKLRAAVGLDSPDEQFTYECASCGTVFESETVSRQRVDCPECGSDDVRSAPNKSPS